MEYDYDAWDDDVVVVVVDAFVADVGTELTLRKMIFLLLPHRM